MLYEVPKSGGDCVDRFVLRHFQLRVFAVIRFTLKTPSLRHEGKMRM